MALVAERVELARRGRNPAVVHRMPSGWAVMGDVQFLAGDCLLLPDPVVPSLHDLDRETRGVFLQDMALLGDAILQVTGAARINYEILGNSDPELHVHLFPRYADEPDERRRMPVWFYDWQSAVKYDGALHGDLHRRLQAVLQAGARPT